MLYSRASISFTRQASAAILELCLRDAMASRERRTHKIDWTDGSLCSLGRRACESRLETPREDNVSSGSGEIRRDDRKEEGGQRGAQNVR